MKYSIVPVLLCLALGCQVKEKASADGISVDKKEPKSVKKIGSKTAAQSKAPPKTSTSAQPKPVQKVRTTTTTGTAKPPSSSNRQSVRSGKPKAKWPSNITWETWETGRQKAAETGKPLCLVVYADWCPRCRELAPVFGQKDIAELAKKFIMVKQDQDTRPAWLQAYADQGRYVPRVFFFGVDGQLRSDVTSGHPRFPFFYSSRNHTPLMRSMNRASKG